MAGSRGREAPRLAGVGARAVCAPGMQPAPRRAEDWQSGSERASPPRAGACPSPAAYNGVPSPRGLRGRGGWVCGHLSAARGLRAPLPATAPLAAELSVAAGAPGTLQLPPGPDQMLLPCVGLGQGRWPLSPRLRVLVPSDPQGVRVAARSPEPARSEGKVRGALVYPPAMAKLVGQETNRNNGSHVYGTFQFPNRFTVYEVLRTVCSSLWFTTCCTVDKVL